MSRVALFQNDYAYGMAGEKRVLPLLQPYLGSLVKIAEATHNFDFEGEEVLVELKDRRVKHDQYPTTLLPYCKIEAAQKQKVPCWFVFSFTDGIYCIKYNKKQFSKFEVVPDFAPHRRAYNKKTPTPHILIPVESLVKLETLPRRLEEAAYPAGLPIV